MGTDITLEVKKDFKALGEQAREALDTIGDKALDTNISSNMRGRCPKYKESDEGALEVDLSHNDTGIESKEEFFTSLDHVAGLQRIYSTDRFTAAMALSITQINATGSSLNEVKIEKINGAFALVDSLQANDPLEGLIISQIAASYQASMEVMGKMLRADRLQTMDAYQKMADKLNRAFIRNVDALEKHRRNGKQTVVVKHVTVETGAQAIVGDVHGIKPKG